MHLNRQRLTNREGFTIAVNLMAANLVGVSQLQLAIKNRYRINKLRDSHETMKLLVCNK